MAIKNEYMPRLALHPGRMLIGEIKARHMSQKEFAERTGLTTKHLSDIVNGKAAIQPDVALAFEAALGTPAHVWLNLQAQYDEIVARRSDEMVIEDEVCFLRRYPYNDMRKLYPELPNTRNSLEKVRALRQFFCVSSLKTFTESIVDGRFTIPCPAFRTTGLSGGKAPDLYALAAWERIGRLKAERIAVEEPFNAAKLRAFAKKIAQISAMEDVGEAWDQIRSGLNDCGVKIVLVPYLPKTYINGAMYWEDETPVIILNAKSSYWDTFIFTLMHEIGHILEHGRSYMGLSFNHEIEKERDGESKKEEEADAFAGESLIPMKVFDEFADMYRMGLKSIIEFAKQQPVDCGIVSSRLVRKGLLDWRDSDCRMNRRQVMIQ